MIKPLTAADRAALDDLPESEWFDVLHAPIARPSYRCERLEAAGLLERRVIDAGIADGSLKARTEYRRR
ncbi:MAG: hypothetical protein AMXMBFR76_21570 [Pseudomonadota bacterium]